MKIENIEISKIIPYSLNNRKHPDSQINHIANSIKEFGFLVPILIDQNNILIAGHGRLEAVEEQDDKSLRGRKPPSIKAFE